MTNSSANRPIHGGNLWKAAEKYNIDVKDIVDFSSNVNPLGPSPSTEAALKERFHMVSCYPDPESVELKRELSNYLNICQSSLLLGNGAVELIYFLGRYFDKRRVVTAAPSFSEYGRGSVNSSYYYLFLNKEKYFQLNAAEVIPHICPSDVVYLCNPNNPTGKIVKKEDLMKIYEECINKNACLVVDEAFIDYLDNPKGFSLKNEAAACSNLIVLRSLTKFFSLPGLRLGYLISSKCNVEAFDKLLPTWRINSFAETAGIFSLQDSDYMKKTRDFNKTERSYLAANLSRITGLMPFDSHANFILVDCRESGRSAEEIEDYLGKKGLLIRNCKSFENLDEYYFRVAVKFREQNNRLLNLLSSFLG